MKAGPSSPPESWKYAACSLLGAVAMLLPLGLGCGPEPYVDPNRTTVSGVVTFDGKPLPAGTLTFISADGGIGTSISISEGNYKTSRVPLGKNLVTIQTESLRFGSPHLYTKIPARYVDPSKSGLTVDVQPGVNENVNFELTK